MKINRGDIIKFNSGKFNLNQNYTLSKIREVVGDPGKGGKWVKGYLMHDNEMFIFANIGGGGFIGHDYENTWIDKERRTLDWRGDKQSKTTDKYITFILSGDYPIHLFTREQDYIAGSDLTYRGLVTPVKVVSDSPVKIILEPNNEFTYIEQDEVIPEVVEPIIADELYIDVNRSIPKRSSTLRLDVLKLNQYTCEIDAKHTTFISASTDKPYMETHHIIPLSLQKHFEETKLDSKENLACLCPNCHRLLHYGKRSDKINLLNTLYENHIAGMQNIGINISTLEELFIYYI